jgi:hypothetical protein
MGVHDPAISTIPRFPRSRDFCLGSRANRVFQSGYPKSERDSSAMTRLLLILFSFAAHAEESLAPEPEKLTKLREAWTQAKEREFRPIKENYLNALIKLRKQLTGQDNLAGALLVRDEIEFLTQGKERADDGDGQGTPRQLSSLRSVYQVSIDKVVAENDQKYLAALEAMRSQFATAGDLEGALAIRNELELLRNRGAPQGAPEEDGVSLLGEWQLIEKSGTRRPGVYMELHADGTFEVKGERQWSGTWKFSNATRTRIQRKCDNGSSFTIRYEEETGQLIQNDGASYGRFGAD